MNRSRAGSFACGMLAVALALPAMLNGCGDVRPGPPDVIFITIDTLRADHLSCRSEKSPVSTHAIDGLAADSILFRNAWSPISVTAPSFCTVMTGRNPGGHGVVMNLFRGGRPLNEGIPTLAEALKNRGYATAAFVSGFTLQPALRLNRGFQVYEAPEARVGRFRGRRTVNRSLGWLEEQEGPVFLWMHLYDPHGPWNQVKNVRADDPLWIRDDSLRERIAEYQIIENITDPRFYRERYGGAVAYTDAQVGRFLENLRRMDRYEPALIVFLADHGESFTERELWFDHGTTTCVEQLKVPLLVKLPGGARAGIREDRPVELADVAPTVLEVLGIAPFPGMHGQSLLRGNERAVLVGESSHCKEESVLTCHPKGVRGKSFAARDSRWTLVYEPRDGGPRWSLDDRVNDPGELYPLAGDATLPPLLKEAIESVRKER